MHVDSVALLSTFGLMMATAWLGFMRGRIRPDSAWPLLYYVVLVIYSNRTGAVLNSYVVYVAVACGLLLRFEFMNARLVTFVRVIEAACLIHIAYSLLQVIGKF